MPQFFVTYHAEDDVRARMPDSFVALEDQSSGILCRDPHASVCESREVSTILWGIGLSVRDEF